ncbi:MAG: ABC transporter substrate-binding protein [Candidatus Hydrothermales bacterium]
MNKALRVFNFFKMLYDLGLYVFTQRKNLEDIKNFTHSELKTISDTFKELEKVIFEISNISNNIENQLKTIYDSLPQCIDFYNNEIKRIDKILNLFENLSKNTFLLLNEIHHIEIVSRNSEIKAFHLGEMGKGLQVVSQELSKLAQRIITHGENLSIDIEKIKENFESLKFRQGRILELVREISKYEKSLDEIFENLRKTVDNFLYSLKDITSIYSERKTLFDELFKNIVDLETKSLVFFADAEKVLIYSEIFNGNDEIKNALLEMLEIAASSPSYLKNRIKNKLIFFLNNIDTILKELNERFLNFEKSKSELERKLDIIRSIIGKISIQDRKIKELDETISKVFKLDLSYYLDQINNFNKIIKEFFSHINSYKDTFSFRNIDLRFLRILTQMKEDLKDGEILSLYSSVETARSGIKEDPLSAELKERVRISLSLSEEIIRSAKDIDLLTREMLSFEGETREFIKFFDVKENVILFEESFEKIGEMTEKIGKNIEIFRKAFEELEQFMRILSLKFKEIEKIMPEVKKDLLEIRQDNTRFLPQIEIAEEEIREEISLRLPLSSNPVTFNPYIATDATSNTILENIHRALFMTSPLSSKVIPALVEKFEIEKDGLLYIFYLRKNVKFHNGEILTSYDVRDSLLRSLKGSYRNYLDMIKGAKDFIDGKKNYVEGIRVVDENKIEIELEYPFVPLIYNLSLMGSAITKERDGELIGLGPFKLKNFVKDEFVELEAFEDYFAGRSNVDRIIFFIKERETKKFIDLFLKGEIDVIEPSMEDEKILKERAPHYLDKIKITPELSIQRFDFNNRKFPFTNIHFRKAINYAIDKDRYVKEVLMGRSIRAEGIFAPSSEVYNPNLKGYEYNIEKAKEELLKSGVKLPIRLKLTISESETNRRAAKFLIESLGKLGIEFDVETKPWKEFLEAVHSDKTECHILGWIADTGDPDSIVYPLFHSNSIKFGTNETRYSNPVVDKLIEEARRVRVPEERKRIYQEIEKRILEDAPSVFLYHPFERILLSEKVIGIWPHSLGHFRPEIAFKFP